MPGRSHRRALTPMGWLEPRTGAAGRARSWRRFAPCRLVGYLELVLLGFGCGAQFLSSGSSGRVCAMGDPERPEAARPEEDEVNVAVASSSTPESRPALRLQVAGTCKSVAGPL